jgi:hypothetical protein
MYASCRSRLSVWQMACLECTKAVLVVHDILFSVGWWPGSKQLHENYCHIDARIVWLCVLGCGMCDVQQTSHAKGASAAGSILSFWANSLEQSRLDSLCNMQHIGHPSFEWAVQTDAVRAMRQGCSNSIWPGIWWCWESRRLFTVLHGSDLSSMMGFNLQFVAFQCQNVVLSMTARLRFHNRFQREQHSYGSSVSWQHWWMWNALVAPYLRCAAGQSNTAVPHAHFHPSEFAVTYPMISCSLFTHIR